jgi:cation diffusion facilitator family transporter
MYPGSGSGPVAGDSKGVVLAALFANAAIAAMKGIGYLLTASPSMLSETLHSLSDTGNQVLLLVGLQFSEKEASRQHPFGWGKAEFFYGFVVSMFLFLLAGWESLRHGYEEIQAIRHGHDPAIGYGSAQVMGETISGITISFVVLGGAFLFELYALEKATKGMRAAARRNRYDGLWETFRKTKAAAILTAFTEDLLALTGLVVAAIGLGLSVVTGNPIYDAIGAVIIGLLLMGFSLILAWEQKRLIVGEAMEPWQEERIGEIIRGGEGVRRVEDLRTVHFGPQDIVVTADVVFDPSLPAEDVGVVVDELEQAIYDEFGAIRRIYLETELRETS